MYKHPIRPQFKYKPNRVRDETRDMEVLRLISQGLTYKQAAERVGLRATGVKAIVERYKGLAGRPWMSTEVEFLREHYMKSYVEWISKKLNRTVPDIEGKARELDLINQPPPPPAEKVHLAPIPLEED